MGPNPWNCDQHLAVSLKQPKLFFCFFRQKKNQKKIIFLFLVLREMQRTYPSQFVMQHYYPGLHPKALFSGNRQLETVVSTASSCLDYHVDMTSKYDAKMKALGLSNFPTYAVCSADGKCTYMPMNLGHSRM